MKKIYAVDFDGTLSLGSKYPKIGEPNADLIDFLNVKQKDGNFIILWTCRRGKELDEAIEFCKNNGLNFDSVNENLPEVLDLFGGDTRKIYADYYIDDKNYNPFEETRKWREEMRARLKGE